VGVTGQTLTISINLNLRFDGGNCQVSVSDVSAQKSATSDSRQSLGRPHTSTRRSRNLRNKRK